MDLNDGYTVKQLDKNNIDQVYSTLITNIKFYKFTHQIFLQQTLEDETFDPKLTLVVCKDGIDEPIAFLMVVSRTVKFPIKKTFHIKFIIISDLYQRLGIGTEMFNLIYKRIKKHYKKHFFIFYDVALARYLFPGVDTRFTSLYYFMKKNKFKKRATMKSMTYPVKENLPEPEKEKKGVFYGRALPSDKENTLDFIEKHFSKRWATETSYGFEFDPPSVFIAKDKEGAILGFAIHNTGFVGRFGPTGVNKKLRGKGIGGILLKWCIWDLSQQKIDDCIIAWIGPGIFYSKVLGAYLSPLYYLMFRFVW